MFDFDEIDLNGYLFTYFTESHIEDAYNRYLQETEQTHTQEKRNSFIFEYVKNEVLAGYRRYSEHEQQWVRLKWYAEDILKQSNETIEEHKEDLIKKAYILYDQCIVLAHEGFEIPNIK